MGLGPPYGGMARRSPGGRIAGTKDTGIEYGLGILQSGPFEGAFLLVVPGDGVRRLAHDPELCT